MSDKDIVNIEDQSHDWNFHQLKCALLQSKKPSYYQYIHELTDDEFASMATTFHTLTTIQEQTAFLITSSSDYTPFFSSLTRVIDGISYSLGFSYKSTYDANSVGNTIIDTLVTMGVFRFTYESFSEAIDYRLKGRSNDKFRVKDLIDEELAEIQFKVNKGRGSSKKREFYFTIGYTHHKRTIPFEFFHNAEAFFEILPNEEFCIPAITSLLEGATAYEKEAYLSRLKENAPGDYLPHPYESLLKNYSENKNFLTNMLIDAEVIDPATHKCILTDRKLYKLSAVIRSLKISSKNPLSRPFNENDILQIFNNALGTHYTKVTTGSKDFSDLLRYRLDFINKHYKA